MFKEGIGFGNEKDKRLKALRKDICYFNCSVFPVHDTNLLYSGFVDSGKCGEVGGDYGK